METPQTNPRTLKIEPTGDFFKGKIKPRIRLTGYWLERAGFKPGWRVSLKFVADGVIELRAVDEIQNNPIE